MKENLPAVLACSTLKESYCQQLLAGNNGVEIVYLKGSYDLPCSCISLHKDYYMKPQMLKSQFEALEEPSNGLTIDVPLPVVQIVVEI